ncbi:hypothetical protein SAMN05444858_13319 [Micromonospora avicenniae]|uniref:Uncharacterized protein n=1 Tax=Micromonospora avicenniae TaxID=1198245 RepID=A0A1N7FBI9_9ACTN|nr:hypothetical protein SAMN05444858_13319 [Micromonospora avicenniae]
MSEVPRYLLFVYGPAGRTEGSKACRGTVGVRPFRTEEPVRTPPAP